jgi:outer membrane protein assembly factor BamA
VTFKNIFFFLFLSVSSVLFSQNKTIIDVEIKGAKKTNSFFLKQILKTKKGRTLDSITLQRDIIRLKRLPAISHAYFQVLSSTKNTHTVLFYVEENGTLIPNINIWTTTNKTFSYKIGLYEYNLFGKNITLGGFYQNNGFDSYALNFRAPFLFSKKWGLGLNFKNWKSEEPLYFGDETANYLYNNVSYEVLGLHRFNLKNEVQFGVTFFNEKYQYLSGATAPEIPQKLDLDKSLYKLVYTHTDLEHYYQYIQGFKNVLQIQYVTANSAFQKDFFIAWNDVFYYNRIGDKGNWANRLRFGLSSNQNSPFAPFALDNNVNLRGVGILVDRGTGSFVWNTEFRHTIYDKKWFAIQTNLFTDFGTWRNPGGEINDFFESKNLRVYSGIGLRFISKKIYNATFRIDYGLRLSNNLSDSKGGLVFGIGQYF